MQKMTTDELVKECFDGNFKSLIEIIQNKNLEKYDMRNIQKRFIDEILFFEQPWEVLKSPTLDMCIEQDMKVYKTFDAVLKLCDEYMYDFMSDAGIDIIKYDITAASHPIMTICRHGMIRCVNVLMQYFDKIPTIIKNKWTVVQYMVFWSTRSSHQDMLKCIVNHPVILETQMAIANAKQHFLNEASIVMSNLEFGVQNIAEIYKFYRRVPAYINGEWKEQNDKYVIIPVWKPTEVMLSICMGNNDIQGTINLLYFYYKLDLSEEDMTCDGTNKYLRYIHGLRSRERYINVLNRYTDQQMKIHLPAIICFAINKISDIDLKGILEYIFTRVDIRKNLDMEYINNIMSYLHMKERKTTLEFIKNALQVEEPDTVYEEPDMATRMCDGLNSVMEVGKVNRLIKLGDGVVTCQICMATAYNIYYCYESRNVKNKHYMCKNCLKHVGDICPMCRSEIDTHKFSPIEELDDKSKEFIRKHIEKK